MKTPNLMKTGFALLALGLLGYFGFTYQVAEGENALALRFGAPRAVVKDAGLHARLPWPFEEIVTYDTRRQYLDSGYLETLTGDKKNIILQTWLTWHITDPLLFHVAVGSFENAERFLGDLATDAKNSVMGHYPLSALVSLKAGDLAMDAIEKELQSLVAAHAAANYGITVDELKIKRLGFPASNLQAVLDQMAADRNKLVVQLSAEGQRDAALIRGKADVEAAELRAKGQADAARVKAENEKEVARIYADAHNADPTLYRFLTKLRVLESTVDTSTVLVMPADKAPFDALAGAGAGK